MSAIFSKIIPFIAFILCLHPIYTIAFKDFFGCSSNKLTFYTNISKISIFAHKRIVIIVSIILFFLYLTSNIFILSVPLLLISWISFIRDRFKSIARGLGAPGYFSFFTLFSICILEQSSLYKSHNLFLASTYMLISSIIFVEFGHIFISAGIFKFLDSRKNSLSFAMGMMNPMWSKIYRYYNLIHKIRYPLNYLGPINQILGGILLLSGIHSCQILGCIILSFTFISITPFCKLAWLCPSIAITSIYLGSRLDIVNSGNMLIFYACVLVRSLLSLKLFIEYFQNRSFCIPIVDSLIDIYRKIMGVIIWKVFTYDVVKYVGPSPSYANYLRDTNSTTNKLSMYEFNKCFTSVYHSIAMCSFLSSRNYLNKGVFEFRLNRYLKILNLNSLSFLSLDQNDFIRHEFKENPFLSSTLVELKPNLNYIELSNDIDDGADFDSYTKS